MKKKELVSKYKYLDHCVKKLQERCEDLEKRQNVYFEESASLLRVVNNNDEKHGLINYLISTKFLGKIKHKRLVSKFKETLRSTFDFYTSFEDLKDTILKGSLSVEHLRTYLLILSSLEKEQEIVDYCNKEEEK